MARLIRPERTGQEEQMAIYTQDNENDSRWNRGEHQVMLKSPHTERPFGYCDGTKEDEDALMELAAQEGVENASIVKRALKTGREVWTLHGETEDHEPPSE